MKAYLFPLAALFALSCETPPTAPTPGPAPEPVPVERVPVYFIGVEPVPVPLGEPAQIILGMTEPMPDVTAWARFNAVSPDRGYNFDYDAKFPPGETTSTTPIATIDSHDRAGRLRGADR